MCGAWWHQNNGVWKHKNTPNNNKSKQYMHYFFIINIVIKLSFHLIIIYESEEAGVFKIIYI